MSVSNSIKLVDRFNYETHTEVPFGPQFVLKVLTEKDESGKLTLKGRGIYALAAIIDTIELVAAVGLAVISKIAVGISSGRSEPLNRFARIADSHMLNTAIHLGIALSGAFIHPKLAQIFTPVDWSRKPSQVDGAVDDDTIGLSTFEHFENKNQSETIYIPGVKRKFEEAFITPISDEVTKAKNFANGVIGGVGTRIIAKKNQVKDVFTAVKMEITKGMTDFLTTTKKAIAAAVSR